MKKEGKDKNNGKITSKQVVALIGVALLALLYIGTLAAAIMDSSASAKWFRICLFATVAIPLLIWVYVWIYGKLTGTRTIADAGTGNFGQTAPQPQDTVAADKD